MNETFVPGFFYAPLMSPQRLTVPNGIKLTRNSA